jgi:hypothetical protein
VYGGSYGALTCQIHVVAGKHQAAINSNMNNCGTKHRVMLPTSKLNSSDSQVWGAGIFLIPLQERFTPALFKNVMLTLRAQAFKKITGAPIPVTWTWIHSVLCTSSSHGTTLVQQYARNEWVIMYCTLYRERTQLFSSSVEKAFNHLQRCQPEPSDNYHAHKVLALLGTVKPR